MHCVFCNSREFETILQRKLSGKTAFCWLFDYYLLIFCNTLFSSLDWNGLRFINVLGHQFNWSNGRSLHLPPHPRRQTRCVFLFYFKNPTQTLMTTVTHELGVVYSACSSQMSAHFYPHRHSRVKYSYSYRYTYPK